MKIKTKLFGSLIIFMLLMSLAFGVIAVSLYQQIDLLGEMAKDQMENVKLSNDIAYRAKKVNDIIRTKLLDIEKKQWDAGLVEIDVLQTKVSENIVKLERLNTGKLTEQNIRQYKELKDKYFEVQGRAERIAQVDPQKAVKILEEEGIPIRVQMEKEIDNLNSVLAASLEQTIKDSNASILYTIRISSLLFIAALLVSFSIKLWVIKSINRNINEVLRVFQGITFEKLKNLPRVEKVGNDELGEIGHSYNALASSLERQAKREAILRKKVEEQTWMKMELAEIAVKSEGIVSREALATQMVSKLAKAVGASFGAFYFLEDIHDEARLIKIGGYALDHGKTVGRWEFSLGEGIVGQCAKDKDIILVKDMPENYIRIISGTGDAPPKEIIAVPAIFKSEVHAVIELASFSPFSALHMEFLKQATENIAVTLDRIGDRLRIEHLLNESQTLTEELQTQSEELQLQQEELRSINEQLHDQYKQAEQRMRDLQIVKSALVDKAAQLELGSKYKSEFLANMSHELRTPLNSMMVLSQVLMENKHGNLTKQEISYANTIYQSGQDLLYLINDILDLSKVESGTVLIMESEIYTRKFIETFDLQFRPIAEQKGLQFQVQIDENMPDTFYSDEQRLKQILINLLSNAFKFTDSGTVTFAIRQQETEQGIPVIAFAVSDTGIGIAPAHHAVVFEAFQQVDGTTKRRYNGTGLGLSISRKLAELLGGSITLDSMPHKGSIFTLYLPAHIDAQLLIRETACTLVPNGLETTIEEPLPPLEEQEKKEILLGTGEGDHKILVVDDDMRNIYSLTSVLESMNLEVIVAENGKEAVQIVENRDDIGLVLMDIMMPEMDGFEAIQRIRQNPNYSALPIIALTAKAMKNDREQCLQAGASDYICKPVNVGQLQSLIKVWLSK